MSQEPKLRVTASRKNGKPLSVVMGVGPVIRSQYWLAQKGAWELDEMTSASSQ
jgi:hypothetical protein